MYASVIRHGNTVFFGHPFIKMLRSSGYGLKRSGLRVSGPAVPLVQPEYLGFPAVGPSLWKQQLHIETLRLVRFITFVGILAYGAVRDIYINIQRHIIVHHV